MMNKRIDDLEKNVGVLKDSLHRGQVTAVENGLYSVKVESHFGHTFTLTGVYYLPVVTELQFTVPLTGQPDADVTVEMPVPKKDDYVLVWAAESQSAGPYLIIGKIPNA